MNLNNIWVVICREYTVRVKRKSFILITLCLPILFVLLITIPLVVASYSGDEFKKIALLDRSEIVAGYFVSSDKTEYHILEDTEEFVNLKKSLDVSEYALLVDISELDSINSVSVTTYSSKPLNISIRQEIEDNVSLAISDYRLSLLQIENIDEILESFETRINAKSITINDDGTEKRDDVEIYMAISFLFSFIIYMCVLLYGNMVMQGVLEEKTNRVVEVLVSSIRTFDLMFGKVIGILFVALTQLAIWIVFMLGISMLFGGAIGHNSAQMMNDSLIAFEQTSLSSPNNEMLIDLTSVMLNDSLSHINIWPILRYFFIYFILGYLLYASMFAAIGAAADNEADTTQLSLPIILPVIISLIIMLHTFQYPDSGLSIWSSIIPFTAPLVMLARIPFGIVSAWEIIISVVLLIITIIVTIYLTAKIYRVGILSYGKKASFKDLFTWIKQNN